MKTVANLDFVLRAGEVQRFHTNRTHRAQDIGCHTWGAMILLDYITAGQWDMGMMRALMFHDVPEICTGDVPAPAKHDPRFTGLATALEDAEQEVIDELGLPDLVFISYPSAVIARTCDSLDLCFFASREIKSGNKHAQQMYVNAMNSVMENINKLDKYAELRPDVARIVEIVKYLNDNTEE